MALWTQLRNHTHACTQGHRADPRKLGRVTSTDSTTEQMFCTLTEQMFCTLTEHAAARGTRSARPLPIT